MIKTENTFKRISKTTQNGRQINFNIHSNYVFIDFKFPVNVKVTKFHSNLEEAIKEWNRFSDNKIIVTPGDIVKFTKPYEGEETEINLVLEIFERGNFLTVKIMNINSGLTLPSVNTIFVDKFDELTIIDNLKNYTNETEAISFYSANFPLITN